MQGHPRHLPDLACTSHVLPLLLLAHCVDVPGIGPMARLTSSPHGFPSPFLWLHNLPPEPDLGDRYSLSLTHLEEPKLNRRAGCGGSKYHIICICASRTVICGLPIAWKIYKIAHETTTKKLFISIQTKAMTQPYFYLSYFILKILQLLCDVNASTGNYLPPPTNKQ